MDSRLKKLVYQTLQMLRMEYTKNFHDSVDADDVLFSNLDFTKSDLKEIYSEHPKAYEFLYMGSVIDDTKENLER